MREGARIPTVWPCIQTELRDEEDPASVDPGGHGAPRRVRQQWRAEPGLLGHTGPSALGGSGPVAPANRPHVRCPAGWADPRDARVLHLPRARPSGHLRERPTRPGSRGDRHRHRRPTGPSGRNRRGAELWVHQALPPVVHLATAYPRRDRRDPRRGPAKTQFTLGQFFQEWGVRLDGSCAGGYCEPGARVVVFVDGKRHRGNPAAIRLASHEEIALVIGTPPSSIPSTYAFPSGE